MAPARPLRPLRQRATFAAYRAGQSVARALPSRLSDAAARRAARGLAAALPERRHMVERHLRRVQGSGLGGVALRREVREVFESYGRYWLEAFRLPDETPESIDAKMRVSGLEHLDEAYRAGQGVILAAPHLGGWDFGGAWLAVRGYRPIAVAEQLEPPELFDWFVGWRARLGLEIVPAGPDAGAALLEAVHDGRVVGLVSDRDILGSGIPVEFFGEWTTLPAGPATLALRTGAPLLPAAIYYEGEEGHLGVVRPPLDTERRGKFRDDVTRVTRDLARTLEDLIRRAPEQWHLMQPNWPSDPGWPFGPVARPAAAPPDGDREHR